MKKIFYKIPILRTIALVLWQGDDFKKFKNDLSDYFETLQEKKLSPTNDQLDRFLSVALPQLREAVERKEKYATDWRVIVPTIIGAFIWTILKKNDFDSLFLFFSAKYILLFLGIFSSWFGAVMVSIRGQEVSFIRSLIRNMFQLREESDLCVYQLINDYFENDHGLNSRFKSSTRIQVIQMLWGSLLFLVMVVIFLVLDFPEIIHLFNI